MTPLERAALALYEATRPVRYRRDCTQVDLPPFEVPYTRDGWVDWSALSGEQREAWIAKARAVIEAIREPSEAMEQAGYGETKGDPDNTGIVDNPRPDDAWRDMIDALLKE